MRIDMPVEQQENPLPHLAENYAAEMVSAGLGFSKAVYQYCKLTLREAEAARARTAEINGCRVCQSFRAKRDLAGFVDDVDASIASRGAEPDEDFYQNVSKWRDYPEYSDRERLAIAYAEGIGLDPQGTAKDEVFWQKVKAAFSDDEIVDLTYAIASWIALGRATHVLGMDATCAWTPSSEVDAAV